MVLDWWWGNICSWGLFRGSGWKLLPPESKRCNTDGRSVWTTGETNQTILQNKAYNYGQFDHRPYAYDVTEGRPSALGVKRSTATCVIAKHAARGATPACHTAGLARPGPRTERLSQCQCTLHAAHEHNTCALRDTSLASLLWRCDPLWRQCIRSIAS